MDMYDKFNYAFLVIVVIFSIYYILIRLIWRWKRSKAPSQKEENVNETPQVYNPVEDALKLITALYRVLKSLSRREKDLLQRIQAIQEIEVKTKSDFIELIWLLLARKWVIILVIDKVNEKIIYLSGNKLLQGKIDEEIEKLAQYKSSNEAKEKEISKELDEALGVYCQYVKTIDESYEITFEIIQGLYWLTNELNIPFYVLIEDFISSYPHDIRHEIKTLAPRLKKNKGLSL